MNSFLNTPYTPRLAPEAIVAQTPEIYLHPVTGEYYITLERLSKMCNISEPNLKVWCRQHQDMNHSKFRKARMLDGSLESVKLFSECDIVNILSYFNLPLLISTSILGLRYYLRNLAQIQA